MNISPINLGILYKNNSNSVKYSNGIAYSNKVSTNPFLSVNRSIDSVSFGADFALKNIIGIPDPCSGIIMITPKVFNAIKWPVLKRQLSYAEKAGQIIKQRDKYLLSNRERSILEYLKICPDDFDEFRFEKSKRYGNIGNLFKAFNSEEKENVRINKHYTDDLINTIKPFRKESMFDVEKTVFSELLEHHIANPNANIIQLFKKMRPQHEEALKQKQFNVISQVRKSLETYPEFNTDNAHEILDNSISKIQKGDAEDPFKNAQLRRDIVRGMKDIVKTKIRIEIKFDKSKTNNDELNRFLTDKMAESISDIVIFSDNNFDIKALEQLMQNEIKKMFNYREVLNQAGMKEEDLSIYLKEKTKFILSKTQSMLKPVKNILGLIETLPNSSNDVDAFVVKYSEPVLDKNSNKYLTRDPVLIMKRFIEPSVATIEHVFPQSPLQGVNDAGGASNPMNYISESKKYNSKRGSLPFYSYINNEVPDMPKYAQKYIDKVIYLINSKKVADLNWYPAAIKKTLFWATRGKVDLDISKLNHEYLHAEPPVEYSVFNKKKKKLLCA